MARIRTVKPSLWADEKLTNCSLQARLTFIGLLTESDDEGRQLYSGARIAGAIFPLDGFAPKKVMGWVGELEMEGIVHPYEVERGSYLCIPKFKEHQVISHKARSTYPVCPTHGVLPEPLRKSSGDPPGSSGNPPEALRPEVGSGSRKGNTEEERESLAPDEPARDRDLLFEAVCEVSNIRDWSQLTDRSRGSINKAVAELRDVGATPIEVNRRAENYHASFEAPLTPQALAKHWAALTTAIPARRKQSNFGADRLQRAAMERRRLEQDEGDGDGVGTRRGLPS